MLSEINQSNRLKHIVRCKQVLMVAREDYLNEPFITCNLPGCSSRFCRACLVVMEGQSDEHTCKVDEELDALMKANGWRYCPGTSLFFPVEPLS
jgi:hypothetical protein